MLLSHLPIVAAIVTSAVASLARIFRSMCFHVVLRCFHCCVLFVFSSGGCSLMRGLFRVLAIRRALRQLQGRFRVLVLLVLSFTFFSDSHSLVYFTSVSFIAAKFWAIFMDDRPFYSDALYKHANVQSEAVFSCGMTVMDKIYGWIDEETWVGSKFAACVWIYTKGVLTEWRKPTPEMEDYLKRKQKHVARRAEGGVVRRGRDEFGLVAVWINHFS